MNHISGTSSADGQRFHLNHLRVGRWSEAHACYSITKRVANRQRLLATHEHCSLLLSALDYQRQHERLRLLGFCIMPDHYHALFFLLPGQTLSEVISSVSKYSATQINRLLRRKGPLWQEGFYDHRCRDDGEIEDGLAYMEHNPVRAGLVATAAEWRFSSAHPRCQQFLDREWYNQVR